MKICFVNLKFEKGDVTNFRRQEHTGIGYIAAACIEKGYETLIINGQFENMPNSKIIDKIRENNPDIVGITLYEELLEESLKVINQIKEYNYNIKIVVGGHYATFNCENLIKYIKDIDFINLGEGEISFPELVEGLVYKRDLKEIKGLCFKDKERIVNTGISDVICDLDSLKYPVRKKIDRSNCITNISASRGCYGACSFCSTRAFYSIGNKNRIRIRNPISVVNEIEYLVHDMGAYHFFFTDDNFMVTEKLSPGWMEIFVNELRKRKINIIFNFDCRVDDINEKIFLKLKQVGLIGVFLGVESNSERTLQLYNKTTSVEKNMNAVLLLRKLRIDCWIGNIMFHPLTSLEDIECDIKFFEKIKYCLYFNYSNPVSHLAGKLKIYKGTSIYDILTTEGVIEDSNLQCSYKFIDLRVEKFYKFIQKSKAAFQKLLNLDPIHLIEVANKNHYLEMSNRIHMLSRKYMKMDFEIFKKALSAIKKNENIDIEELYKLLVDEEKIEKIYVELNKICNELSDSL